jgi:4a-hydroxytetrahydrobiopterin dehydratase
MGSRAAMVNRMTEDLATKKCLACEGGVPRLAEEELGRLLKQVPKWERRGDKVVREFRFANFVEAMAFVNRMADVAEAEGHHPDFCVHYRQVEVSIWTHAVGGLTENDFILAAKIDVL